MRHDWNEFIDLSGSESATSADDASITSTGDEQRARAFMEELNEQAARNRATGTQVLGAPVSNPRVIVGFTFELLEEEKARSIAPMARRAA